MVCYVKQISMLRMFAWTFIFSIFVIVTVWLVAGRSLDSLWNWTSARADVSVDHAITLIGDETHDKMIDRGIESLADDLLSRRRSLVLMKNEQAALVKEIEKMTDSQASRRHLLMEIKGVLTANPDSMTVRYAAKDWSRRELETQARQQFRILDITETRLESKRQLAKRLSESTSELTNTVAILSDQLEHARAQKESLAARTEVAKAESDMLGVVSEANHVHSGVKSQLAEVNDLLEAKEKQVRGIEAGNIAIRQELQQRGISAGASRLEMKMSLYDQLDKLEEDKKSESPDTGSDVHSQSSNPSETNTTS